MQRSRTTIPQDSRTQADLSFLIVPGFVRIADDPPGAESTLPRTPFRASTPSTMRLIPGSGRNSPGCGKLHHRKLVTQPDKVSLAELGCIPCTHRCISAIQFVHHVWIVS